MTPKKSKQKSEERYGRLVKGASAKRSKNADEMTPKSKQISSFEKQVSTQRS